MGELDRVGGGRAERRLLSRLYLDIDVRCGWIAIRGLRRYGVRVGWAWAGRHGAGVGVGEGVG